VLRRTQRSNRSAAELARLFRGWKPKHTLRLAFFVNEEPPYFKAPTMGSKVYADELVSRGERVAAMFSLETLGYYSERPGSQRYPFPLNLFYPESGDFVASRNGLAETSVGAADLSIGRRRRLPSFRHRLVRPLVVWPTAPGADDHRHRAVSIPALPPGKRYPDKLDYDRPACGWAGPNVSRAG
jgi:hypothetical protein